MQIWNALGFANPNFVVSMDESTVLPKVSCFSAFFKKFRHFSRTGGGASGRYAMILYPPNVNLLQLFNLSLKELKITVIKQYKNTNE